MTATNYVPLVASLVVLLPVALAPVSTHANRIVTRFALHVFGDYTAEVGRRRSRRREHLRAAHVPTTFRVYAAKTLLYASVAAIAGAILGIYLIWGVLLALSIDPEAIRAALPKPWDVLATLAGVPDLSTGELFLLVLGSCLTLGAVAGMGTYWARWWYPRYVANARKRRIDMSMPRTVAFLYALSRSGMAFPAVMKTLSAHRRLYGEAAREIDVAVKNMELFATDVVTAVQTMGRRSPSEQFNEFSENLSSVLQSGRSISGFLERQYHEYREKAEAQQEQVLNLLSTLAEGYVTVLVAGPLFMITILVVIGVTVGGVLPGLWGIAYVVLPLANLGFIVYLSSVMETFEGPGPAEGEQPTFDPLSSVAAGSGVSGPTDGGTDVVPHPNLERLAAYRRLRSLRRRFARPLRTLRHNPEALLWVTVPVALVVTAARVYEPVTTGALTVRWADDVLVQAVLFVLGTYAIAYEYHRRHVRRIEAAVPDFLDRLASVNEAGMTVVESIGRVRESDLGPLDDEVDRVWRDVQWGSDVESALLRFAHRVRTRTISRATTLITNAMSASGDIARVLRIAANQSKADRRLRRERRQEMMTYVVVVYISFLVFVVILAALTAVLLPNLPEQSIVPNNTTDQIGDVGAFTTVGSIGGIDQGAYTLVFLHTALIQGCLSGLVAGQMSGGDVRDGLKHATILLALAYVVFLVAL